MYKLGLIKMKDLFELSSDGFNRHITALRKIHIYPTDTNLFHILTEHIPTAAGIKLCIDNGVVFEADSQGITPLHNIFSHSQHELADIIFSRAKEVFPHVRQQVFETFENIFVDCIKVDTPNVVNFLSYCLSSPDTFESYPIPRYAWMPSSSHLFKLSESRIFTPEVGTKFVWPGAELISIHALRFKLDLFSYSKTNFGVLDLLRTLKSPEIYSSPIIRVLLEYNWRRAREIYYAEAVLFVAFAVGFLLYASTVLNQVFLYEVAVFVVNIVYAVLLLIEQFGRFKEYYLSDYWAATDTIRWVLIFVTIIFRWKYVDLEAPEDDPSLRAYNGMLGFIILIITFRMASYFRIFKETSKYSN